MDHLGHLDLLNHLVFLDLEEAVELEFLLVGHLDHLGHLVRLYRLDH